MFSLKKNLIWIIMLIVIILLSFAIYICSKGTREGMTVTNENLSFVKDNVEAKKLYNGFYYFPLSGAVVSAGESNATKITREGDVSNYNISSDEKVDVTGTLVQTYKSWDLPPTNANEHLYYIPFGKHTYMHVIDYSKIDGETKYNFGFFASNNGTVNQTTFDIKQDIIIKPNEENSNNFADAVSDEHFDSPDHITYKLYPYVHYNMTNGDLYIKNAENYFDIYNRDGLKKDSPSNETTISSRTTPFVKADEKGGNLVVYVPHQKKTLIVIFHKTIEEDKIKYKLVQVCRFAKNKLIETADDDESANNQSDENNQNNQNNEDPTITDVTGNQTNSEHTHTMGQLLDISNNVSDYYKWYWYWNSSGSLPVHFSEDYMLKTQMVPPVCPSCPSCPSGGCCTNCGGNGGNGTVDASGNSIVNNNGNNNNGNNGNDRDRPVSDAYNKTLDTTSDLLKSGGAGTKSAVTDTVSGVGNFAQDSASGIGKFAQDSAGGIGNFAKDTAGNTVELGREVTSGTVGLGKEIVGGTVGLGRDIVGGTVGLGKDIVGGTADFVTGLGSGAANVLNNGQNNNMNQTYGTSIVGGQMNQRAAGQMNQVVGPTGPTDPYTYNGKLQKRPPSDFIPRTANFSAFAK